MTGLQFALVGGALAGLGVALLLSRLVPAHPDLRDTLDRLSPTPIRPNPAAAAAAVGLSGRERLGVRAVNLLPAAVWVRTPVRELAVLRVPVAAFYGEKVLFALAGLAVPSVLSGLLVLLGFGVAVPVAGTVLLAVGMFFLPDFNVRDDARRARAEFARALGAYIDLVALERNSGSGARQAMEVAADIGDSWVFRRLGEDLARSRWSGQAPWEALHTLARELGLPDLADLADIMRLSGEEGAQVYANLRARSAGMRSAMLNAELTKANEIGERMSFPMSLLGVIFLALLVTPALLRLLGGT